MKKYIKAEIEVVEIKTSDVITTSPGIETTPKDENDGLWELDISVG